MLADRKKYNNFDYNKYNNKKESTDSNHNKKRLIICYTSFLIIIGLVLVYFISQTVSITHLNSKVNRLENELDDIEQNNNQLLLELSQRSSLSEIEKVARNELNMIEPERTKVMVLHDSDRKIIEETSREKYQIVDIIEDIWKKINVVRAGPLE